ncbi:MAG TPA: DUF899 family protein [Ignavibacteria bacterium]|jgi:predicted dithiol-disulfide oxidoreductase (DUF899 family)
MHEKQFPNESLAYREARDKLLEAEIILRRQIEQVAALRRQLPMGGKIKEDYVFEELNKSGSVKQTKLSELFKPGKDTLIIYSFMFGPNDKVPCTSCSSIMDGVNGMVHHANDRINFVAVAKSPVERIKEWIDKKGWHKLRFLSSAKNSYNKDYFAENEKGSQLPVLNVFSKNPDGIFHFYATELLYVPPEPGQNGRHVDMIWPLWNLYDYTPEGRGTDWYPKHSYEG